MGKYFIEKVAILTFLIIFIINNNSANAQFFTSDVDPCYLRWNKIVDKKKGDIIFPDYILNSALRVSFYRDTISRNIDYNIPTKMRRFPVTLHPTNLLSNGLVTYAPQRMELNTMPNRDNYSLPWLKQLVVHEYRHVAQLSNLNQGFTKGLSYLLGEQILGLAAATMPTSFYEGDAVVAETQFAMWGRGKQPSFNIGLRADLAENKKFNVKKYRSGSLNSYAPDQYLTGYYYTQYMTQHYGDDFWGKVLRYAGRNLYMIDPTFFAYRKYSDMKSSIMILEKSMEQMREFWRETSSVPNSAAIVNTNVKSYSTYSTPLPLSDSTVVVHKKDLNKAEHFIIVNINSGKEQFLRNTGYLSSSPVMVNESIYWCEIAPSLSWGTKNHSSIFKMDLYVDSKGEWVATRPKKIDCERDNYFFITPCSNNNFAAVTYDKFNQPNIVVLNSRFKEIDHFSINKEDISFNGLTYDNITNKLYAAIVDNRGSSIIQVSLDGKHHENLIDPNYGTYTSIVGNNGKLYYTSISTGKNEIHIYDLLKSKEYQLTSSKYGSETSMPMSLWSQNRVQESNMVAMTTYTLDGYMVSSQNVENIESLKELEWKKIPENTLNYPFKEWNVQKMDTIDISTAGIEREKNKKDIKKYSKALNSINIHSWIPLYADINSIIDERNLSVNLGVNIMSQNLLNSVVLTAGYGRVGNDNLWSGDISYNGLPVKFNVGVEYGGGEQLTYNFVSEEIKNKKDYFEAGVDISIPLNLSSGANNRFFNAILSYSYTNSLIDDFTHLGTSIIPNISEGLNKVGAAVIFQNTLRTTQKALRPILGYQVQLNSVTNPFRNDFSSIYMGYARGYLPGPFPQGSIALDIAYQYQTDNKIGLNQVILFPRGNSLNHAIKQMGALSVDYRVPVCYPNGGIGGLLNFQRISVATFFDYAKFNYLKIGGYDSRNSYGASLILDVNLLSFRNITNFEISIYKPSDKKNVMYGISYKTNF